MMYRWGQYGKKKVIRTQVIGGIRFFGFDIYKILFQIKRSQKNGVQNVKGKGILEFSNPIAMDIARARMGHVGFSVIK